MNKILSPAERRALKARAHPLKPTVMVGNDGLSASVLQEIDSTLKAHELIKIRVEVEDSDEREDMLGLICASTAASAIDHIGKILVIYRERPGGGGRSQSQGQGQKSGGRGQQRSGKQGGQGQQGQSGGPGGGPRKAGGGNGPVWTKSRPQRGRKNRGGRGGGGGGGQNRGGAGGSGAGGNGSAGGGEA
jgi:RNA-binding protein